jgi:hypothetical protein
MNGTTPCFKPIGVYKKLAILNPESMPVNVISKDIERLFTGVFKVGKY